MALEHYVEEASAGHPDTIIGLVALRFYVVQIVDRCVAAWTRDHGHVTNYRILLNKLARWRRDHQDRGLLVTFNYDSLLEDAFRSSGRRLDDIRHYTTRQDFRLIKPHGSTEWRRGVAGDFGGDRDVIAAAPTLDLLQGPIAKGMPQGFHSSIPAIAIPTHTKTTFECPPEHRQALEEWLPEVDRILVVGWRAQERYFLELLVEHLADKPGIEGLIVSSSRDSAKSTVLELERVLPKACLHPSAAAGFSGFTETDGPVTTWLERRLHQRLDQTDPDHRTVRSV
jgi:hypothetical protein